MKKYHLEPAARTGVYYIIPEKDIYMLKQHQDIINTIENTNTIQKELCNVHKILSGKEWEGVIKYTPPTGMIAERNIIYGETTIKHTCPDASCKLSQDGNCWIGYKTSIDADIIIKDNALITGANYLNGNGRTQCAGYNITICDNALVYASRIHNMSCGSKITICDNAYLINSSIYLSSNQSYSTNVIIAGYTNIINTDIYIDTSPKYGIPNQIYIRNCTIDGCNRDFNLAGPRQTLIIQNKEDIDTRPLKIYEDIPHIYEKDNPRIRYGYGYGYPNTYTIY